MGDAMAHIQSPLKRFTTQRKGFADLLMSFWNSCAFETRFEGLTRERVRHVLKIRCRLFRATLLASDQTLQANKPIKARTYLDGTQLGMRSGPCWKC